VSAVRCVGAVWCIGGGVHTSMGITSAADILYTLKEVGFSVICWVYDVDIGVCVVCGVRSISHPNLGALAT
jgi:hypothetical protein